jgi:hypothetical protein
VTHELAQEALERITRFGIPGSRRSERAAVPPNNEMTALLCHAAVITGIVIGGDAGTVIVDQPHAELVARGSCACS